MRRTPRISPLDGRHLQTRSPRILNSPWIAAGLIGLVACGAAGDGEGTGPGEDSISVHETGASPPFTVRGRWEKVDPITYHVDDARGGTVAEELDLSKAVEAALASWAASGEVRFEPAADLLGADILFSFEAASHSGCPPFGRDTSVAHAGMPGPGTFVHFDASSTWVTASALEFAALHETGHVLGLDHTEHPRSLMHVAAEEGQARMGAGERAGIASLYGGELSSDPSDIWVRDAAGASRVLLWRAAPPENTDFIVFDANGDGYDEVIVWRTDRAGAGVMTLYLFDEDLQLEGTVGPLWGAVVPGSKVEFSYLPSGHRVLSCTVTGADPIEQGFDESGQLTRAIPEEKTSGARFATLTGDLNGDREPEVLFRK